MQVTPPRVPRDLLLRPRLRLENAALRDRAIVIVQAPPGFGKTSLLAQWRLEHLGQGAVVGWLSAQTADGEQRFLQSLVLSLRVASGRQRFGRTLLEGGARGDLADITEWLAEIAQMAFDIVLIIDAADRLPAASRAALTYLCHNAPANLRVIVAARSGCDLGMADLKAYGQCVALGAHELRLRFEESMALIHARLGARLDADESARLHELTEGWPLVLQLALTALARIPQPHRRSPRSTRVPVSCTGTFWTCCWPISIRSMPASSSGFPWSTSCIPSFARLWRASATRRSGWRGSRAIRRCFCRAKAANGCACTHSRAMRCVIAAAASRRPSRRRCMRALRAGSPGAA